MESGVENRGQSPGIQESAGREPDAGEQAYLEQSLWSRLGEAASGDAFAAAWLEIQCKMIEGARCAVVVLGAADKGPYAPVAFWPAETDISLGLSAVAEIAMAERKGSVRGKKQASDAGGKNRESVAYPLLVDDQLCGVVAMEIAGCSKAQLRVVMRQLQWGCAWLEVLIRRKVFTPKSRLVSVLELVATCLEHERFQAAATALVTELAIMLSCEWVSIGFLRGRHTRVQAFSHSADYGEKTNLIRSIGAAMDEAMDQQTLMVYPPLSNATPRASHAHADLMKQCGVGAICTVPLSESGRLLGGLMLARPAGQAFSPEDIELCQHVGSLVGPLLEMKRKDDRWLLGKTWDTAHRQLSKLLGRGHIGIKLSAVAIVVMALFLVFAEGEYRVSADAALEGSIQRVVTAPLAGYIEQANVRAGDIVSEGQVLTALEDKDLQLERVKWVSQKEQRLREYSKALADQERARVRILGSQIEQAETQVALLDEQIARTRILAPFDGIVVTGDLSQSLSAPVERGQVLFEIAPLDSYRVIMKIDERDIAQVAVGQKGQLVLAGLPGEVLPMVVQKLTPVSTAEEGRNYFRAEARLESLSEQLRPGMVGVGKISIDRRRLVWIWTHKLTHWVRLWAWSWWP